MSDVPQFPHHDAVRWHYRRIVACLSLPMSLGGRTYSVTTWEFGSSEAPLEFSLLFLREPVSCRLGSSPTSGGCSSGFAARSGRFAFVGTCVAVVSRLGEYERRTLKYCLLHVCARLGKDRTTWSSKSIWEPILRWSAAFLSQNVFYERIRSTMCVLAGEMLQSCTKWEQSIIS